MQVRRGASRTADVWVHDVVRGSPTRLTFDGDNRRPIWSPDGKRLVYGASTTSANSLHAINADGGSKPFLLLRPTESTDRPVTVMHVVLNWAEELKRLVPAK